MIGEIQPNFLNAILRFLKFVVEFTVHHCYTIRKELKKIVLASDGKGRHFKIDIKEYEKTVVEIKLLSELACGHTLRQRERLAAYE